MVPAREKMYLALVTLFCVIVVSTNCITVKLFHFPMLSELALPAGLITYPFTFILGDLITELFGKERARLMVLLGFAMSLVSLLIFQAAIHLPAHPEWTLLGGVLSQEAFATIFGLNGIVVFASMVAYAAAQFLDITIYDYLRKKTNSRHLWLRNNVSTLVSQLLDTALVNSILLGWGLQLPFEVIWHISLVCYFYKAIFALCDTPVLYLCVALGRLILQEEAKENPVFSTEVSVPT